MTEKSASMEIAFCDPLSVEPFIVTMCGQTAYAIPISCVECCIAVSADILKDTVCISNREYRLIKLEDNENRSSEDEQLAMCILCKKRNNEYVAFCAGNSFYDFQSYLANFTSDVNDMVQFGCEKEIQKFENGFYGVFITLFGGGRICFLKEGYLD